MTFKIDYKIASPAVVSREIGQRMAVARLKHNITQSELAEQAGIAVRTLRRLEVGEGGSIDTLIRLMQALDLAPALDMLLPSSTLGPMAKTTASGIRRNDRIVTRKRARKTNISGQKPWSWDEKEAP